jgi:hypothetical protein
MINDIDQLASMREPAERRSAHGGTQLIYKFPNGYGASVVCHAYSYGGDEGLLELAVLGTDGHLDYDTPVTDDVEGRLSAPEAAQLLQQIENLS